MKAVLNEIDGYDHSRTHKVGTPAIFGLNFQSVSTAQKLPASDGLTGGYTAKNVPGPLLVKNLDFVNTEIGALTAEIAKRQLSGSTTLILSAKHGQSPTDPTALTRVDDGPLLDGLNAAWKKLHPGATDLVTHAVDDDAMLLWLSDRSAAATAFAKKYLLAQNGTGTDINKAPKGYTHSGLSKVYVSKAAADYFHVQGRRRPGPGPVRCRAVRCRLHRRHQEDRRARRRPLRRPRRTPRRVGRFRPGRRARLRERADQADSTDDPEPARSRPPLPAGRPKGTHHRPAGPLTRLVRKAGSPPNWQPAGRPWAWRGPAPGPWPPSRCG